MERRDAAGSIATTEFDNHQHVAVGIDDLGIWVLLTIPQSKTVLAQPSPSLMGAVREELQVYTGQTRVVSRLNGVR